MVLDRVTPFAVFANAAICAAVQPLGQSVRRLCRPPELTIELGLGEVTPPENTLLNNVTLPTNPGMKVGAKSAPTDQLRPVSGLMLSKPPPSCRRNPGLLVSATAQVTVALAQPGSCRTSG